VIAQQLGRLAKHSAIYGLGAVVSRLIGVFLLPVVTHYLTRAELGAVDTLIALSVVLVIVLRAGISMAFFRFYFDAEDDRGRTRVVRTSFWFTMVSATTGLVIGWALAGQISEFLFSTHSNADLVRAAFVLVWAQMNYEQLTSLFRVEERSVAYVSATLANVLITVVSTILLVAVWDKGALGVLIGNFTGTLGSTSCSLPTGASSSGSSSTARSSGRCSASGSRSYRRAWRSGRSTSPTASSC